MSNDIIEDLIKKHEIAQQQEAGMISPGWHGDYDKNTYQEAVAKLEALGFTNITLVDLDDAVPFIRKADTIKSITVNGHTYFDTNDYFSPDVPIIITYH